MANERTTLEPVTGIRDTAPTVLDADQAAADVAAWIKRDVDAGIALGVQGTPSFFLNGERL